MQSPLKPVASSDDPRVIIDQITDRCRYRVAETPNGYLIAESVISGRKSGAEMARLYGISSPTVSRIVAKHRMILA
jgi:hypothetical protein